MKNIKLVALDIDGVALVDTFSPVIYDLIKSWGYEYTPDIERNVFSRPRQEAARYLRTKFSLPMQESEIIDLYFKKREKFLAHHPIKTSEGLHEFLDLLKSLDLKIICYGGLEIQHFQNEMKGFLHFFDPPGYICTNDFRPGIREICSRFQYQYHEVLFIDDVCSVAEEAENLGAAFIGVPGNFEFGFQGREMKKAGVKSIVTSLSEIDETYLQILDNMDKKA